MKDLPVRKMLNHTPPRRVPGTVFFVTICATERGGSSFVDRASAVLEAARHRQAVGKWFLSLFLVMPDHLHMLVSVSPSETLTDVIADFKRYLSSHYALTFQAAYFDTRIRDDAHFAEIWHYIVNNPVSKGLVREAKEWPYIIAFSRSTGKERLRG